MEAYALRQRLGERERTGHSRSKKGGNEVGDKGELLRVRVSRGVLFVTIDNPPINLLTIQMATEFLRLSQDAAADKEIRVIVFDSANPDFFIAHYDVAFLVQAPDEADDRKTVDFHDLNRACEAFRRMPKVSIAKVEGRARGGGSEFLMALDMRFGAIGKAIVGQPELPLGITPGAGGTQRLPRLIGVGRAMEVILGGGDLTAEMAERYGYFNRALPAGELGPFVDDLAFRIASHTPESIALAKKAILAATELPLMEGLIEEASLSVRSLTLPSAKRRMNKFLELGGQTFEMELDWSRMVKALGDVP
jgi:enoyl-CoA hydratase/carnithine racemase